MILFMNALFHLAVFLCIILLMACAAPNNSPSAPEEPRQLPTRTLAKGQHSGIQEKMARVLKTPEAWDRLWQQHSVRIPPEEKPPVDFDKEMVIAMTMGRQRTGGYSIEITEVRREKDQLKIEYRQTSPPPDAMTIQVLTAPFHLVAVPRTDLEAEFVETRGREREEGK